MYSLKKTIPLKKKNTRILNHDLLDVLDKSKKEKKRKEKCLSFYDLYYLHKKSVKLYFKKKKKRVILNFPKFA